MKTRRIKIKIKVKTAHAHEIVLLRIRKMNAIFNFEVTDFML